MNDSERLSRTWAFLEKMESILIEAMNDDNVDQSHYEKCEEELALIQTWMLSLPKRTAK